MTGAPDAKAHWEAVYAGKPASALSWYRPHLDLSLGWMGRIAPGRGAAILDVGGGASTLADDLLERGYRDLTVLDISTAALTAARQRLRDQADRVRWIEADITHAALAASAYDVWHDRAVFHFLTAAAARRAYVAQLTRALKPGGHLILATFAPEGPQQCSRLPVMRYHPAALQAEVGAGFRLLESCKESHRTPGGAPQPFLYALFTRQRGDALSASGRPLPGTEARPQPDQREGGASTRWPSHLKSPAAGAQVP